MGCQASVAKPPVNVIVVSLDTLRADHLGVFGDTRGLTPNLDRLADESVVFASAFAVANETLLSHAALWTSRYPSELGHLDTRIGQQPGPTSLAGRLHAQGYETAAFVAGGHLSRAFGLDDGFATYDDSSDWASLTDTGQKAVKWLESRESNQPYFLFVHAYDTHDRYLKPTPFGYSVADRNHRGLGRDIGRTPGAVSQVADAAYLGTSDALEARAVERVRFARGEGLRAHPDAQPLSPHDIEHLAQVYAGSVAWLDAAFGLWMAELDARGVLDDAYLVVLSDHGHELGERGSFHHRFALSDETLWVPLMVRPPGGRAESERVSAPVTLLDLMPTVLSWVGAPPDAGARGKVLVEQGRWTGQSHPVAFAEGGLRLLSASNGQSRLTVEGLSADNPWTAALLDATPVGGPAFAFSGAAEDAQVLRRAMAAWRLDLAAKDAP